MSRRTTPTAADWWVDRPRAVLFVRAALYLAGTAVLAALAAAAVGFLGVLAAFATVTALADAGGTPGVVPLGGLGTLLFLTLGASWRSASAASTRAWSRPPTRPTRSNGSSAAT